MVRPSFAVSTIVVTTLVVAGFAVTALRPLVPERVNPRLVGDPEPFMRQASNQAINWRAPSETVFAEARRLGRPIMLVVGASWSQQAQTVDRDVFTDPEVTRSLNRNFICIRVDGVIRPEYLNAYLPLTRLRDPFLAGFQVWFLDPSGRAMTRVVRTGAEMRVNSRSMLRDIQEARDAFLASIREGPDSLDLAAQQSAEIIALRQGGSRFLPFYSDFRSALIAAIDARNGGIPLKGIQSVPVNAFRFLLLSGELEAFSQAVDPILLSPLVDLQDGGFFRLSSSPDWHRIEYSKVAVQNAEWLSLLTLASLKMPDKPIYRRLALATFDFLLDDLSDRGQFYACRISDGERNGRSPWWSVPPNRMLSVWSETDRRYAQTQLGMDPGANPQMVPHLRTTDVLDDTETLDRLMRALERARYGSGPERVGEGQADVQGYVTALMLDAARLLGDDERMERLIPCMDVLERFRSSDTISPSLVMRARDAEWFGDYLSAAEAYLADFRATGRVPSLEAGIGLIKRARFLFSGEVPGEMLATSSAVTGLGPIDVRSPELADNIRESTTAQSVRLFNLYGRILGPKGGGLPFIRLSHSTCYLYSELVGTAYPASGFINSTMPIGDDAMFFVVGVNSVAVAAKLSRLTPGRQAIPVMGPVRPDLRRARDGVYLEERGAISGPFSVAEAAERVPSRFRLD